MNYSIEYVMSFLNTTREDYTDEYRGILKKRVIERNYNMMVNLFSNIIFTTIDEMEVPEFPKDEVMVPDSLKMRNYDDMKRLGHRITRKFLNRYGFYDYEVNWLLQRGDKIEDD